MPFVLADRVKETTTTAGTGAVTLLGASTGFQSFAAIGNANNTYYCIAGQTNSEWEVGIGTYTAAGTTLSRDTVLANSAGTQPTALTFSAGTKDVFVTYPAGRSVNYNTANVLTVADNAFTLQDNADPTKQAQFELSGITTATTRIYTLPNLTGSLATIGTLTQTFSGTTTFSGATVTVGSSTATSTYGLGSGASIATATKTINIGTAGLSGSTTNINYGSVVAGSLGTHIWGIGGEQMRLTTTGLGIGTSSPQARLEVGGAGQLYINQDQRLEWNIAGSTTIRANIRGTSGNALVFGNRVGGVLTDTMTLDGSGNLGLGVTPSAWGSFYKAIESTAASEFAITSQVNGIEVGRGYYKINAGFASLYTTSQAASKYDQTATGEHRFFTAPSGTAGNAISFTQAMTLDASGRLAIGATSASNTLDVAASGGAAFRVYDSADVGRGLEIKAGSAASGLSTIYTNTSTRALAFGTNNTERMRLDASGNLGIGTTSPTVKLEVGNGSGLQQALISGGGYNLILGASGGSIFGFASQAISTVFNTSAVPLGVGTSASQPLIFGTANTERMRLDPSGNLGVGMTPVANNGILQLGSYASVEALFEAATVTASAPAATTNFDVVTQAVQYYTTNASANFTFNIRGNGTTSLNTIMATGQSCTLALLVTNGATAFRPTVFQVDGTAVTPRWQGGTAPTAGNASSIDVYVFTVIKTASATFTVLASQTRFA